ncbi:hypothetical protein [Holdemania massiliensis]|uniref:hypothetical protein n=1 Tax=Holdemania massiliensis TaxID=1468449 RepID=UPI00352237B1
MNNLNVICLCIGAMGGLVGIYSTIQGQRRNGKKEVEKTASTDTTIKMDLEYIKEKTDENTIALKEMNLLMIQMNERITRVEERVNEAHKRIDRIDN